MNDGFWPGVIVTAMLMSLVFAFSQQQTNRSWRDQIADHGCAEYYLDDNHDRQWRWKAP